jgi:hypothetical protein
MTEAGREKSPDKARFYHDKTIHVIVLESENEEELAKVTRSISLSGTRGVNVLQFKIGDDVLRALLAALEESARTRGAG